MAAKPKSKIGKGLAVASTLCLLFFNHLHKDEISIVCVLIALSLIYAFSDWAVRGSSPAEKIGRWVALPVFCGAIALVLAAHFWPNWELTGEQRPILAEMAKQMPKDMVLLVEFPTGDKMAQDYGEQIRQVFQDNGAKVNKIRVLHGLGPDPEGMLVITPQEPLDGSWCASYRYGSALAFQMSQHGMPTVLTYDTSGVKTVDCSSLEIWVGKKPRE